MELLEAQVINLLQEAETQFDDQVIFLCSFSMEDMIILDIINRERLGIEIYTIDTGRLNPETYEFMDMVRKQYSLKIKFLFPDSGSVEKMLESHGPNLFYDNVENRKLCCNIRKVDPLSKLLETKRAWITGIRSDQTAERKISGFWETKNGIVKINPLIFWSVEQVKKEIELRNIPVNHLYSKGYRSIGCAPCTRAVQLNEGERAGRWWWESGSKECGIHLSKSGVNL
ncbi:MAG: phosphoadenylyl-sulfate reductase [Thermoplasmataceae archaeon]